MIVPDYQIELLELILCLGDIKYFYKIILDIYLYIGSIYNFIHVTKIAIVHTYRTF